MTRTWKEVNVFTGREIEEDAPGNSAGAGNVAGIGVGPKGEPGVKLKKKKKKDLYDGRTKSYKNHRAKLEAARLRRQEILTKKKSGFVEHVLKTMLEKGEGRPRGAPHIENERYWDLKDEELRYIIKDAGEAMKANPTAKKATTGPGNWADQVNDAHTVLGWRKKKGIKK